MNRLEFFSIIERNLDYQNPTSAEKLDRLIDYCGILDGHRVLDVGCGKGWLIQHIAQKYDVVAEGIELSPDFVGEGREKLERLRLRGEVIYHQMPAAQFDGEPHAYAVAFCVGASFAIGTFEEMLAWLRRFVKPGGVIAMGDIYARGGALPAESAAHFSGGAQRSMFDTCEQMNRDGLTLIGLIDSSLDDWDRYESQHWLAAEAWLRENPDHPDADAFSRRMEAFKYDHLRFDRDALGWAIFISRVA